MRQTKYGKKRKQNRAGVWSVSIIVLALVMILSYRCIELYNKNVDYEAQEQSLQTQLSDEESRQAEISDYEQYVGTDAFVEDVARNKLGLVYNGEMVFKETNQ